jgi:hypothetical protein
VQPPIADESDENDDEDRMNYMITHIGRGYGLGSTDLPLEVHNFYKFLGVSEEKVHDGTNVIVLQAVTRLMIMKSKYNFSN